MDNKELTEIGKEVAKRGRPKGSRWKHSCRFGMERE